MTFTSHGFISAAWEQQYLDLLQEILLEGIEIKNDRTGVGTYSVFGRTIKVNLQSEFPAMTTKKLFWKGVVHELQWIVGGGDNVHWLQARGVNWWNAWAAHDGSLGPIYGVQLRDFNQCGHDQLAELITNLRERPYSRRHLVTAWNPDQLPDESVPPHVNAENGRMALAPCHAVAVQFRVRPPVGDGKPTLDCLMFQRSCDIFLGVPANIPSYALLTHVIADIVDMTPGELTWVGGDVHLYSNHREQAIEQLRRTPGYAPSLDMQPVTSLDAFVQMGLDCFKLVDYLPQAAIKGEVAV